MSLLEVVQIEVEVEGRYNVWDDEVDFETNYSKSILLWLAGGLSVQSKPRRSKSEEWFDEKRKLWEISWISFCNRPFTSQPRRLLAPYAMTDSTKVPTTLILDFHDSYTRNLVQLIPQLAQLESKSSRDQSNWDLSSWQQRVVVVNVDSLSWSVVPLLSLHPIPRWISSSQ